MPTVQKGLSHGERTGRSRDRSPIETPNLFGELLPTLRDTLGWTQADLGAFFGVSKLTAHRWEKQRVGETEARKAALRLVAGGVEASSAEGQEIGDLLLDMGVVPVVTAALCRRPPSPEMQPDEPVDWRMVFGVRDRLGWTQTEFAKFLGVTHSVPAVWESGDGAFGDAIRAALLALDLSSDPDQPDYREPTPAWDTLKTQGLQAFYDEALDLQI